MSSAPNSIRVLDLLVGLILIVLGSWVILGGTLAEAIILLIFAVGLVLIGIARISKGAVVMSLKRTSRAIHVITGLLSVILAVIVLVFPAFGINLLISIVAIALFFTGAARIIIFYSEAEMSMRTRVFHLLVGAIGAAIPVLILIVPGLGFITLSLFASIAFIMAGAARVVSGVTGDI
ncbi:MAG: DUF308 domain-containing protein [Promethearchaeota archaeon]